ncbi:putative copper-transporting ATPase HMA5 [Madurella mycetomatis]|uniref:Copper-transporting ATPase HMA5 n=1 Tax=Madurella mycetomatis TaxID=100816 RepID=A0A150ASJ3_9PEZI|nr:putative copper-transporting ATPase HMA5 [Madurella mycetomatis]
MAPSDPRSVPPAASETVTTSFLIGNLHCPTCVSTIKDVLHESCGDLVQWVSPNIVTSVVTVDHAPAASFQRMREALEESGFEVCGAKTSSGDIFELDMAITDDRGGAGAEGSSRSRGGSKGTFSRWIMSSGQAPHSQRTDAHLRNCEQCRSGTGRAELDEKQLLESTSQHSEVVLGKGTASPKPFIAIESDDDASTSPIWRASVAVGGMTCASCANMITDGLNKREWISNVTVNLLGNSATVDLTDREKADELVQAIEDLGYEATLDTVVQVKQSKPKDASKPDSWRATLAVGGMTCAACANTITKELRKKDWIKDVTVNLLSNSATVEFHGKANADKLVEAIEDLGFDAALDNVVSLDQEADESHERTVEIRVDGLYCEHCPSRVTSSLAGFRKQLKVITEPTRQRPIMKISYVADAPSFTIRRILAAIEACDPEFTVSIHHPPSLEERSKQIQRKHQLQILYRVIFAGLACIPSFVIGILYMSLLPDSESKEFMMAPWTSGISRAQVSLFIMATPVYFFAADLFHRRAIKEIANLWRRGSRVPLLQRFYRFGSMNTLMSLGTTIAYISSVSQMIAAAAHRPAETNDSNFYFDSVVFLTFFLLLGRLIESYSKSRTGDAVEMLGKLAPTTATLVEGYGTEKEEDMVVKADLLDFGDVVRVTHGASPPADGVVVRGESNFDESSLTGESRPVKKSLGDEVFSGTVNNGSSLLVRITGAPGQSLLDQIVNVVREGQTKRAPIERVADLMTSYFVPVVTLIAILTWIVWLSLGLSGRIPGHFLDVTSGGWVAFSLQFAIAVFVVACPCGLALAAPTAIFVGGGLAAKHGILAKGGGEAFEKANRVDCVVFDKTGTLTEGGEPSITDSEIYADETQKDALLAALKGVEENSSHPIAKAIVSFCAAKTSSRATIDNLQEIPGKGMRGTYHGTGSEEATFDIAVGNESLMTDLSVSIPTSTTQALQKWKSEAKSVALIATSPSPDTWILSAILSVSDPIRPEAPAIIRALQQSGTRVWMLSGDNPTTAAAVAGQLGIPADQVIAGVLPTGKADKIKYLQSTLKAKTGSGRRRESATRRATVAMVGDGINDSPALTTADVGIAIGSGADVAISSADFVLVKSDLRSVVTLLDLSRTVFRRIKFNFGWAVVYNCLALPVAAGIFYPIALPDGEHVRLDPVWASLAMALSSISVVVSSLLLRVRWGAVGFTERRIQV